LAAKEANRENRRRASGTPRPDAEHRDEVGPRRGKASDGGDIGCRYTPEMLRLALELRRKGIIKF